MNDDTLQALWSQGKERDERLEPGAIREMLGGSVRRGWWGLRMNAWLFAGMLAVALVLLVISLLGPDRRPWYVALRASTLVVALVLLVWNLRYRRRLHTLDAPDVDVSELVRRQLRFFQGAYEAWLWSAAVTTWILSFAAVAWIEGRSGMYRIGHVGEFLAVSATQVLLAYVLLRFGHQTLVARAVAALQDLEGQGTDATRRVEAGQGARRGLLVLGVLLLAAAVGTTVYVWYSATH